MRKWLISDGEWEISVVISYSPFPEGTVHTFEMLPVSLPSVIAHMPVILLLLCAHTCMFTHRHRDKLKNKAVNNAFVRSTCANYKKEKQFLRLHYIIVKWCRVLGHQQLSQHPWSIMHAESLIEASLFKHVNRWVIWNQDSSILIRKKKRHSATEENEVWIPSSIKFTLRKCCAVKQCHPVVLNRASFVIALSRTLVPSTDILSFHFNFHIYFAIQEPLLLLGRKQKTFSIQKLSAFSVSFPITQTLNVKPLIIILWDLRRLRAWDKC